MTAQPSTPYSLARMKTLALGLLLLAAGVYAAAIFLGPTQVAAG
jgi:hypothetical protein